MYLCVVLCVRACVQEGMAHEACDTTARVDRYVDAIELQKDDSRKQLLTTERSEQEHLMQSRVFHPPAHSLLPSGHPPRCTPHVVAPLTVRVRPARRWMVTRTFMSE